VLSVDSWLILVRSIGGLFSEFLDICEVLLMHVCNLGNLEMDLLFMLILIYAGDLDKRKSLTGYVFTIGGCAVS
jgi:hypothetical protein